MNQGKNIAILGAGESGVGTALLAQSKGYNVWISDSGKIKEKWRKELNSNNIKFEDEKHTEQKILDSDIIVKSPGIPKEVPVIQKAIDKGKDVIGEIEFAHQFTTGKIIGITGTNGKTTTAKLLYHILKKADKDVVLSGNIGVSMARELCKKDHEYFVLEISSFQLEDIRKFKCDIGILLNITPDHLERYDYDFDLYAEAKLKITNNMTASDVLIYNADDEKIKDFIKNQRPNCRCIPFSQSKLKGEGAWIDHKQITINIQNQLTMSIHDLALKGKHNAQNSMASGIAGRVLEIKKESVRESLSDFQNVEHRLEYVAKVHGVEFINDSKATNVNAAWYALECMEHPTVWIVGGIDKGNDYSMLDELVAEHVKGIICLGTDNQKIIEHFKGKVEMIQEVQSAREAVYKSYKCAEDGNTVLLSPACASFDLFESYEDRGNQFKEAVRSL